MKFDHVVKHNGVIYPAGAEVPVDIPKEVELTDNVPAGALDTNSDGSVNAYDKAGDKVGTVDAEAVAVAQEEAGEVFTEQGAESEEPEKPKRGRKSKEA